MSRYTFNPPDEELVSYYLNNKITNKYDLEEKQIHEVNIRHHEPADLPGLAKIESSHTWYFISPVEKFGKLKRTKRASRTGHWTITGNSRKVKDVDGNPIGLKKFLVFRESKNKRSSNSSSTTTQQHITWNIHEFHSFIHHPNKDAFVICKLMKKTRTRRSGAVAEASSAATNLSPIFTSAPILNHPQMLTENKNIVEDYGGDYCNDLEEFLPEYHNTNGLNRSHQSDHFHWETFADISHSWEQVESGSNTVENSSHLELGEYWNSEAVVGSSNVSNYQI